MSQEKRWKTRPAPSEGDLANYIGQPPLVARLLINRGIRSTEVEAFLSADGELGDPLRMKGMAAAIERICQAVQKGELIAVYGDFDADGVTATALLAEALQALGANVVAHIPHRIDEGYGLNVDSLNSLRQQGADLVVTVDCGIRSLAEVEAANAAGLDVIVTDHHIAGPVVPNAVSVVNPKQEGCSYEFKELSGAGVAFKLAQALLQSPLARQRPIEEQDLLELAALGTVADLVPLIGENRAIVKRGLRRLTKSARPGLRALIASTRREGRVDSTSIAFIFGPRLNAAGRLEHARTAYQLLVTRDEQEANDLCRKLDSVNRERQTLTEELTRKARDIALSQLDTSRILIVASDQFPEGIIGLIAGKLQEEFYRPAVAIHLGQTTHRGSARSIPEFSIIRALDECTDLLVRHGGHSAAAGFTVSSDNLEKLESQLRMIAERELAGQDLVPTLDIDAEVSLSEMDFRANEMIDQLAPYGYGNLEPLFLSRNVLVRYAKVVGNNHLKLTLSDGRIVWDGIAFRRADLFDQLRPLPKQVDIVYCLNAVTFQGEPHLQVDARDLRIRA